MSSEKRRKYEREFKLETVRLVIERGRSVAEVSRNLGVHENLIHKWKKQYIEDTEQAFPGKGHLRPRDEEFRCLKRELEDIREERDILKKALAIFSRQPG